MGKESKVCIFLITVALTLVGCQEPTRHYDRTEVVALESPRPKKRYGSVKFYQSKADVPGHYDIIAILSVEGKAGEEAAFIKAFLYRAADLGGDGVIFYRVSVAGGTESGGWTIGFGQNRDSGSPLKLSQDGVYRGEVIHLTETNAPTDTDTQTEAHLISHWESVAFKSETGQIPSGVSKYEFTFLPDHQFLADTTMNGNLYPLKGEFSVHGSQLRMWDTNVPPSACSFSLVGDYSTLDLDGTHIVLRRSDDTTTSNPVENTNAGATTPH